VDAILFPAARLPDREETLRLKALGAVVIGYGRPEHLRAAFLAGCDDYLKDPWNAVELACRLERLWRADRGSGTGQPGGAAGPGHRFPWGVLRAADLAVYSRDSSRTLSLPEYRILSTLLRHRGEPVSREVLYYAIWGRSGPGGSRVVDVHVSRLRGKLLALFPASGGCLRCLRGTGYSLQ
jgi:two-component system OmpR family response regulator